MNKRDLQLESARALAVFSAIDSDIHEFNRKAHHDSQNWYRAVIDKYISEYGGLPSQVGPGKMIKLLYDKLL